MSKLIYQEEPGKLVIRNFDSFVIYEDGRVQRRLKLRGDEWFSLETMPAIGKDRDKSRQLSLFLSRAVERPVELRVPLAAALLCAFVGAFLHWAITV